MPVKTNAYDLHQPLLFVLYLENIKTINLIYALFINKFMLRIKYSLEYVEYISFCLFDDFN